MNVNWDDLREEHDRTESRRAALNAVRDAFLSLSGRMDRRASGEHRPETRKAFKVICEEIGSVVMEIDKELKNL